MPVRIPTTLPARTILERENIFVMGHERAEHQDIRPLRVAILNLMPTKIETETQLLRLLGNSALQVEITLLQTATYQPKNTAADHLLNHYRTWEQVRKEKFDGLVITGAPIEHLPFEEVEYWDELCAVMDWAETNVFSTLYICWGAQAGLYHRYRVQKYPLPERCSVCSSTKCWPAMRSFCAASMIPSSRHTRGIPESAPGKSGRLMISNCWLSQMMQVFIWPLSKRRTACICHRAFRVRSPDAQR